MVDVTELAETEANTSEHQWAVSKGYVSGFVVDALNEDKRVRVVATLKSEYSKLISVDLAEIWEVDPKASSLRWAANNWAMGKGFGGGALIGESAGGLCLVAVTDRRVVSAFGVLQEALDSPGVNGSCHQYAVTHMGGITAFRIKEVEKKDEAPSGCVMLVYYGTEQDLDDDDDEERSTSTAA